jgi:hypothetical protein
MFAAMDESSKGELSLSSKKLASMPVDYVGISFEEPQLYNPAYFSVANVALVESYKKLSSLLGAAQAAVADRLLDGAEARSVSNLERQG